MPTLMRGLSTQLVDTFVLYFVGCGSAVLAAVLFVDGTHLGTA